MLPAHWTPRRRSALSSCFFWKFPGCRAITSRTPIRATSLSSAATGSFHGACRISCVVGKVPSRTKRLTDAYADFQSVCPFVRANRFWARRGGKDVGDPDRFAQLANKHHRPGGSELGLPSHSIHHDSKFAIRPATTQFAHDIQRIGVGGRNDANDAAPSDARYTVTVAHPVDRDDGFVGLPVDVNDDFLDEDADQPLFFRFGRCRVISQGGQIFRQVDQL